MHFIPDTNLKPIKVTFLIPRRANIFAKKHPHIFHILFLVIEKQRIHVTDFFSSGRLSEAQIEAAEIQ
jgi:hypothetical protein